MGRVRGGRSAVWPLYPISRWLVKANRTAPFTPFERPIDQTGCKSTGPKHTASSSSTHQPDPAQPKPKTNRTHSTHPCLFPASLSPRKSTRERTRDDDGLLACLLACLLDCLLLDDAAVPLPLCLYCVEIVCVCVDGMDQLLLLLLPPPPLGSEMVTVVNESLGATQQSGRSPFRLCRPRSMRSRRARRGMHATDRSVEQSA
jgi:hypothetical protein